MLIKLVSSTAISEEGMGKQVKETLIDNKGPKVNLRGR